MATDAPERGSTVAVPGGIAADAAISDRPGSGTAPPEASARDGAPAHARRRWQPLLGQPQRVLDPSFSGTGLTLGAWFFALSLIPSLLPRSGLMQGIVSAVTVIIGYGLGALLQWAWEFLGIPKPQGRPRLVLVLLTVGLGLWAAVFTGWRMVGWQNELRSLYGMEPTGPGSWPTIIAVTVVLAVLLLVVGRAVRVLFHWVVRLLDRLLPRRVAVLLGLGVLLWFAWALFTGVLVNGFFAVANGMFAPRDTTITADMHRPQASERSGSPQSLSSWESLGRQGRYFVGGGPSVAELETANGAGAKEPVRVYVGLEGGASVQARADLLLAELRRSGAFDRKVLVVATTTGTGFLDQNGVDPLEFAWNGDTAIAGVQYSYLPSWISLLADQDAVRETSRVVFDTVHAYWVTLPESTRPKLYLYGLSLGSFGVESVLSSINIINEPIDGALMVGPPFVNPLHSTLTARRDAGSPASLPIYEQGRTVRFVSEQGGLERTTGPWGATRIVYLQHASDPIVFFDQSLAFTRPDWLDADQRGPDVSARMGWFPVVTMWQVLLDLPAAGSIPMGYGHLYSAPANLEAWVAVTRPPGFTAERLAELGRTLAARPYRDT